MTKRPDFAIVLMAGFALGAASLLGGAINRSGLSTDISMLVANFAFVVFCYLTTLGFENVLYQPSLEELLGTYAKKPIDVLDLFDERTPASTAFGEKIWDHRPISRCVLLKTYATDTQALQDKLVSQLLAAVLMLLVVSAAAVVVGHAPTTKVIEPSTGLAISLITIVVSFVFAVVRVYWSLFEIAQRNRNLIREVRPRNVAI
jgi:hypothetical protein